MPIYQNSIIYKLCHCNDLENKNIYVGSTTNFRRRKCEHKNFCNNEKHKKYNSPVYKFIRDNGGWDEWQMLPIEVFPCNDKKELEVRERHHIELLKSKLNKYIPTRNTKEWYEDNKEKILEKKKIYNEDNKEKLKEYNKKYYEDNTEILSEIRKEKVICDHCGVLILKINISRHKKTKKCIDSI